MVDSRWLVPYSLLMTKRLDVEKLRALYNDPAQPAEELACLIPDLLDEIEGLRADLDDAMRTVNYYGDQSHRRRVRDVQAEAKLERVRTTAVRNADLILGRAWRELVAALDEPC